MGRLRRTGRDPVGRVPLAEARIVLRNFWPDAVPCAVGINSGQAFCVTTNLQTGPLMLL
jgi:hypothetical protein